MVQVLRKTTMPGQHLYRSIIAMHVIKLKYDKCTTNFIEHAKVYNVLRGSEEYF